MALGGGLAMILIGFIAHAERSRVDHEKQCAVAEVTRLGFQHCRLDTQCMWTPDTMDAYMDNVEFLNKQCHPLGRLER